MMHASTALNIQTRAGRARAGFTLMEVMMVTLVVAIAAVVVIPSSSQQDPISIQAASAKLSADMEYAQAATVATPADPVIVMFDAPANRYWLANASNPTHAIDRPNAPAGTKYEVDLNDLAGNSRLDLVVEGVGSYLRFDAMGRLAQSSDMVVILSNDAGRIDIMIDAESGSICTMADAGKEATITPGVYIDPSMEQRPGEGQTPVQTASVVDTLLDALQTTVTGTTDALMASTAPVTTTATATINGVVVGITNTATTATTAVASTVTGTTAAVVETTTAVTGAVTGTVSNTTTTVANTATTAANTVTNTATSTVNTVTNAATSTVNTATNATTSTVNTVTNTTSSTVNTVTNLLGGSGKKH